MRLVLQICIALAAVLCLFDACAANNVKRTITSHAMSLALFVLCALMVGGVL